MSGFEVKIKNALPDVASKAYDDLAHPSFKSIGQIISFLPRTIRLGLSKWEKWIVNGEESLRLTGEALREKVKRIPEEKQCEPEPYVAVPTIQQIAYCYDSSELRNMYANLLAASMNLDKKWMVHPGYVDIIKQLTPDEAKLLKMLPRNSKVFNPLIDIKINKKGQKGKETLLRNYTNMGEKLFDCPYNICSYLDNLLRLGLINIPEDSYITDDRIYESLEKSIYVEAIKKKRE